MSYHVSQPRPQGGSSGHNWQRHTERALRWLYGPDHATTRKAMTDADLASWRALGSKKP